MARGGMIVLASRWVSACRRAACVTCTSSQRETMTPVEEIEDHRQLFAEFIKRLEADELPWYEGEVVRNIFWWNAILALSLLVSVSNSIVAALMDKSTFENVGRIALVTLPILGTGIIGLAQAFRFREKEALRESGRIELLDIIQNARIHFLDAKDDRDFGVACQAFRERFRQLEISQHQGYVALHSEPVDPSKLPAEQRSPRK